MDYMGDCGHSVRAQAAEDDGAVPVSRITQAWLDRHGIQARAPFIKWLIRTGQIRSDEWHHTGRRYRRTPHYRPEWVMAEIVDMQAADKGIHWMRAVRFWNLPDDERPKTKEDWRVLQAAAAMGRPHPLWRDSYEGR
ncbi:hypothetical protein NSA19_00905 [Actinomyces bowdenii]|uniref:hypothetical protein n=1 Tax=Actinomyces bowdenii TaxID=131109 RepID=UPI00214A9CD8|nr:hypothetical protein [Actinomyces bowdenii]MCR2051435.1 hypothetical protein [Actinomyces bowdenii]